MTLWLFYFGSMYYVCSDIPVLRIGHAVGFCGVVSLQMLQILEARHQSARSWRVGVALCVVASLPLVPITYMLAKYGDWSWE